MSVQRYIGLGREVSLAQGATSLLDDTATGGTKNVPVASTVGFHIGDTVKIEDDNASEINWIAEIDIGVKLVVLNNLANTYTVAANGKATTIAVAALRYVDSVDTLKEDLGVVIPEPVGMRAATERQLTKNRLRGSIGPWEIKPEDIIGDVLRGVLGGLSSEAFGYTLYDFTTFTEVDTVDNRVVIDSATQISHKAMNNEYTGAYHDFGSELIEDFTVRVDVKSDYLTNEGNAMVFAFQNELCDWNTLENSPPPKRGLGIGVMRLDGSGKAIYVCEQAGPQNGTGRNIAYWWGAAENTYYFLLLRRIGRDVELKIYDTSAARDAETDDAHLLAVVPLMLIGECYTGYGPLGDWCRWRYMFACNTWDYGTPEEMNQVIKNLKLNTLGTCFKHTFSPADMIDSYTIRKGVELKELVFPGCLFNKLTIQTRHAEMCKFTAEIFGLGAASTKETLATLTLADFCRLSPFSYDMCVITLNSLDKSTLVYDASVVIDNQIPDKGAHGNKYIQKKRVGNRLVTGKLSTYFDDETQYDLFKAGAPFDLNLKWVGALCISGYYYTLEIDIPKIVYKGGTPEIKPIKEPLVIDAPFQALYDTTGGFNAEIKIYLTNMVLTY